MFLQKINNAHPEFKEIMQQATTLKIDTNAEEIIYASEGGQKCDNMSFGGVCANNTQMLFETAGRVPTATRDSSLRAKSFGATAIAMAANVCATTCRNKQPQKVKFCTDNATVTLRLKTMEWQQHQPSKTTQPECESPNELCKLHQQLPHVTVHHVKGHQTGKNLSWQAQLNKRCDKLAGNARQFTEVSNCKLKHASATVTINEQESPSAMAMSLHQACTSQNMRKHMNKKCKWGNAADEVDWTVHGRALKLPKEKEKKTMKKFMHEWLPVNGHEGAQTNARTCPMCKTGKETQHHFLWCNHAKCRVACSKASDNFSKNTKQLKGDPAMANLIINSSLKSNMCEANINDHDETHERITKMQNAIRWQQVLKGRVTKLTVQNHDEWRKMNHSNLDGEQWAARPVCHLWKCIIDLWQHRNDELHGETKLSEWHRQNLQEETKTLCRQKAKIDSSDQHALAEPMQNTLHKNTKHMETWTKRTTPRVTAAIRRSQERIKKTTVSIADCMQGTTCVQKAKQALIKEMQKSKNRNQTRKTDNAKKKTKTKNQSKTGTQERPTTPAPITKWFHKTQKTNTDKCPPQICHSV